jgi:hypothetical protein
LVAQFSEPFFSNFVIKVIMTKEIFILLFLFLAFHLSLSSVTQCGNNGNAVLDFEAATEERTHYEWGRGNMWRNGGKGSYHNNGQQHQPKHEQNEQGQQNDGDDSWAGQHYGGGPNQVTHCYIPNPDEVACSVRRCNGISIVLHGNRNTVPREACHIVDLACTSKNICECSDLLGYYEKYHKKAAKHLRLQMEEVSGCLISMTCNGRYLNVLENDEVSALDAETQQRQTIECQ